MMKKLLFILAFIVTGSAMAQVPAEAQITQAQKDNTKKIEQRVRTTNQQVEEEVNSISKLISINDAEKGALLEIITNKISLVSKLDRQNLLANAKASQLSSITTRYHKQLMELLGDERFAAIKKIL